MKKSRLPLVYTITITLLISRQSTYIISIYLLHQPLHDAMNDVINDEIDYVIRDAVKDVVMSDLMYITSSNDIL